MGNKREIAADVARVVGDIRPDRPLIDLFSGMCFVAGAVAPSGRRVWVNDIQHYAELVGRCLVAAQAPPEPMAAEQTPFVRAMERNAWALQERFADQLEEERSVLAAPSVESYASAYSRWNHAGNCPVVAAEVAKLAAAPRLVPYRLCTLSFAWGYFGLQQAIDLDSIRYAIDAAARRRDISDGERGWMRLGLVQTASRLTASPGHLSQYLKAANQASLTRVVELRRRDAVEQFRHELALLEPYGETAWRSANAVTRADALDIWPKIRSKGFRRSVIYADPPYTRNQYSHFYHVLETISRYDYPSLSGRGRYRPDQFATPFSSARRVGRAFDDLASRTAGSGCALVLSYPSNGMLQKHTGKEPEDVLRLHFGKVETVLRRGAVHSSLGAAHGDRDCEVEERVYVAQ